MGGSLDAKTEVVVVDAEALLDSCLRCVDEESDSARARLPTLCAGEATAENVDMLGVRECKPARDFVPTSNSDRSSGYEDSSDLLILSRALA